MFGYRISDDETGPRREPWPEARVPFLALRSVKGNHVITREQARKLITDPDDLASAIELLDCGYPKIRIMGLS